MRASAGLFTYPVLMAADILIYDSDVVPVGKDQKQHIEVTRDIAIKMNETFGEIFKLPEPRIQAATETVPGLDGQKMSKSYGNTIDIFGDEKEMRKRVMSIVTDSTPVEAPKDPDNVDDLSALLSFCERSRNAGNGGSISAKAGPATANSRSSSSRNSGIISRPCAHGATKSWPNPITSTKCWRAARNTRSRSPNKVMSRVRTAVGLVSRASLAPGARCERRAFSFNSAKMSRPAAVCSALEDHDQFCMTKVRTCVIDDNHRAVRQIADGLMRVAAFFDQMSAPVRHPRTTTGRKARARSARFSAGTCCKRAT